MTPTSTLSAVKLSDRIQSLDMMRGIVLFGILLMNINGMGLAGAYADPMVSGGATGWAGVLKSNVAAFFYRYGYLFFVSRVPKVLGMFCIGYVLGGSGFYRRIGQNRKTLCGVILAGIVIGLPANYFLARYMSYHADDYWNMGMNGFYQTIAYALGVVPLALAYVAVFMLFFQTGGGKRMLSPLAPVGKMAFSNYVMQTWVGILIFYPVGLGFMGKVGPVYYTLLGILVFLMQIVISAVWLRFFNYGPVEWLWRSATYKKWQPMKKG